MSCGTPVISPAAPRDTHEEGIPHVTKPKRPARPAHEATVTGRRQLSPNMVRLSLNAPALIGRELEHTDHYIKLLFVPEGADYAWPYDLPTIRDTKPRAEQPVTRTYTFRSVDTVTGDFELDFVLHGDAGLAAPWARGAQVGEKIGFSGPGGAWHPETGYEHFVLAGDESAGPAIAAAIEALPEGATASAYVEVDGPEEEFEMPQPDAVELTWVHRRGDVAGSALSDAVRAAGYPEKKTSWFIHGVAEMIKEMRRFLFIDGEVAKADVSISGYWRLGMTEDQWQASKQEFNAQIEQDEAAAN